LRTNGESLMSKSASGVEYECLRCSKKVSYDELSAMPELKCPNCGYRILKKTRPPIVKHIKAR
jgi:DNA-directed RNA polymerase subunit P